MKINKSVEQATYVLLILALQKKHTPLKSRVLSKTMSVSDSYLKKILMMLKHNELITASASKKGGYQLARPIDEISLKDVFYALELNYNQIEFNHLANNIFDDQDHVEESENKIINTLQAGLSSFYDELDELKLSDLLKDGAYQNGCIDWNTKC